VAPPFVPACSAPRSSFDAPTGRLGTTSYPGGFSPHCLGRLLVALPVEEGLPSYMASIFVPLVHKASPSFCLLPSQLSFLRSIPYLRNCTGLLLSLLTSFPTWVLCEVKRYPSIRTHDSPSSSSDIMYLPTSVFILVLPSIAFIRHHTVLHA
jgi:hypothetical protein